jgi:cytochrome c-type biogenesis protein CcmF
LRWALAISLVLGMLLPLAMGNWSAMVGFGLSLALWVVATSLITFRKRPRDSLAYYGMLFAHLGVAIFVVGVTLVKGYESEKDVSLQVGESVELAGYDFKLEKISDAPGPNYRAARATVSITRGGRPVTTLYPERRIYSVQEMPMTEAAIDPGFTRDLYVSLGDAVKGGAWLVRVHYKPFIDWIWGGCLVMALGGLLAASDRRYRTSLSRKTHEAAIEARA